MKMLEEIYRSRSLQLSDKSVATQRKRTSTLALGFWCQLQIFANSYCGDSVERSHREEEVSVPGIWSLKYFLTLIKINGYVRH